MNSTACSSQNKSDIHSCSIWSRRVSELQSTKPVNYVFSGKKPRIHPVGQPELRASPRHYSPPLPCPPRIETWLDEFFTYFEIHKSKGTTYLLFFPAFFAKYWRVISWKSWYLKILILKHFCNILSTLNISSKNCRLFNHFVEFQRFWNNV